MAINAPSATIAAMETTSSSESYVEWSAVFAGAVLAAAMSFVLLTFGGAIGLSLSSPYEGEGMSIVAFAVAAGLWILWVQVSSFMAGGYLAGRMRKRINDSTEHEVHVRDGAHGLVVWATGVLLGAVLAFGGLGAAASGATRIAAGAATGAAAAANDGSLANSPVFEVSGELFRPASATRLPMDSAARASVLAILAKTSNGDISAGDRAYVESVVAEQTGASTAEAASRVNAAHAQSGQILADAKKAADAARKMSVLTAFFLAASLAASAAAAYVAAGFGGKHRDKALVLPYLGWR